MKVELVKLSQYSGIKTTFYSAIVDNNEITLFDQFLEENQTVFFDEVEDILVRMELIAHQTGARNNMFKENEGRLGDLVCALYDLPFSNLRLYCIRLGSSIIVLGGGGQKPKNIRALQESPKLSAENALIRSISNMIYLKTKDRDIYWSKNEMELLGNLTFETDE